MTAALSWLAPALWGLGVSGWAWGHRRTLNRTRSVPSRITVGGTRGKSTVVRLLTEALRLHGQRVSSRVTGQRPEESLQGHRLAEPTPWGLSPRPGNAEPDELRRWIAEVVQRVEPEALVVENLAFTPESMRAVNEHIALPTLAVLTDCVPDHLDVWPDDSLAIAQIHVRAIPSGIPILTLNPIIRDVAQSEGYQVLSTSEIPGAASLPRWMRDHCALAWSALETLISPTRRVHQEALITLAASLLPRAVPLAGGALFVDLFDANDPVSAEEALASLSLPSVERRIALFAHRRDRPWRLRMFRPWLDRGFDETHLFTSWPDVAVERLLSSCGQGTMIAGLGNAAGPADGLRGNLASFPE
jgi:gamma-polyglutamate synthase